MIVPAVSEPEWLHFLDDLPMWEMPLSPVLVLVPHPDDETLATGGLIHSLRTRGIDVTIVAVTDGENAYEGQKGLGQIRQLEQVNALQRLGVADEKILRLQLPDSDVGSRESEMTAKLLPLVSSNTHLLAPWSGDFHPDHESCGRAAAKVASLAGATLTSYFFWTWHRGTLKTLKKVQLRVFPLDIQSMTAKMAALQCHRSQLEHLSGEPILNELLLKPVNRPFEVFQVG